jgi:acyl-CoA synthetase (AMP-forming)/AMP-acid ligase II
VVAKDRSLSDVEQDLRAAADQALAGYKRPRRYVFLDALPRNAMGKIDRRALKDCDSSSHGPSLS